MSGLLFSLPALTIRRKTIPTYFCTQTPMCPKTVRISDTSSSSSAQIFLANLFGRQMKETAHPWNRPWTRTFRKIQEYESVTPQLIQWNRTIKNKDKRKSQLLRYISRDEPQNVSVLLTEWGIGAAVVRSLTIYTPQQFWWWWRAPQQMLQTNHSLEAYCATLWWRWSLYSFFRVVEHQWNETDSGKPK